MDYVWFLKLRTAFIRRFYANTQAGFVDTMQRIERGEAPFDDPPYSEDPEPAYLQEWLEARDGTLVVGETCISMLSASLKLFIVERMKRVLTPTAAGTVALKKHGLLKGYRMLLEEAGLSIEHAPVDYGVLEEIDLVRNNAQHPRDLMNITSRYSLDSLKKRPSPFFISERDASGLQLDSQDRKWLVAPEICVTSESLDKALNEVETFVQWLDMWLEDNRERIANVYRTGIS